MHESSALTHIRKLTNSSVNCSQLDVELLMMHVLKLKKNELYRDNPQINDQIKKDILSLFKAFFKLSLLKLELSKCISGIFSISVFL